MSRIPWWLLMAIGLVLIALSFPVETWQSDALSIVGVVTLWTGWVKYLRESRNERRSAKGESDQ